MRWKGNRRPAAEGVTDQPLSLGLGSYNTPLSQEVFLSSVDFKCNVGKSFRCLTPLFCASEVTVSRIGMQNLIHLSGVAAFRASWCYHCSCICFCFPFLRLNHMQWQAYLTMLYYKQRVLWVAVWAVGGVQCWVHTEPAWRWTPS